MANTERNANFLREEFEKWALTECFDLTAVGGFYSDNETDAAYKAWQACAARMVPEKKVLPELLLAEYHEAKGWNACVESMLSAAPEPKK